MTKHQYITKLKAANEAYDTGTGTWQGVVDVLDAWRDQKEAEEGE